MSVPPFGPHPPYSDRFLFTIHGLVSENEGLANLRTACEERLTGLKGDSYYYEHRVPYWNLDEATQRFIFRAIYDRLENIYGRCGRLFVVAHSFGTLALVRALEMYPEVTIEGLILLGSIIPRSYLWDGLIRRGVLKYPPLVVVRPLDRAIRFAKKVGGADSGAKGFISNGEYRPVQTYKNGGHCSYYPADCDDIITFIGSGISRVPLVNRDEWLENCSVWNHIMYRLW